MFNRVGSEKFSLVNPSLSLAPAPPPTPPLLLYLFRLLSHCHSIVGVDIECFDCVYSLAKRRGPVPGRGTKSHMDNGTMSISTSPDILPYPIVAGGKGVMGGFGLTGHQNGLPQHLNNGIFPSGLNEFFGAVPAVGVASNTVDSLIAAVEGMAGGANNVENSNFSLEEFNLLLGVQQQSVQGMLLELQQRQQQQQQQLQQQLYSNTTNGMVADILGVTSYGGMTRNNGNNVPMVDSTAAGMMGASDADWTNSAGLSFHSFPAAVTSQQQQQQLQEQRQSQMITNQLSNMYQHNHDNHNDRSAKRIHHTHRTNINGAGGGEASSNMASTNADVLPIPVARHLPLLQPSSADGALLRSYYELSTNDVLNLPPIPTDEEYLARLSLLPKSNHYQPNKFPTYDQSALQAARFSELALGALANEQVSLSMELSNASVICLRNCVDKPAHTSCLYDVSRAYLLLGIFRSFRGDMTRYFKYRRVCMMHILKLDVSILQTE